MSERTPLVFAPGHPHGYYVSNSHYTGSYNRVMYILAEAGFEPHFHQVDWRDPNPHHWVASMTERARGLADEKGQDVVLAGFSLGALTAVLATSELERSTGGVGGLLACSLSPWLAGPTPVYASHLLPPDAEMHAMAEELKAHFCELELPKISVPAQLYVGKRELSSMHKIHEAALGLWPQAESIQPPCPHSIFDESYLRAISQNVGRLAVPTPVATG